MKLDALAPVRSLLALAECVALARNAVMIACCQRRLGRTDRVRWWLAEARRNGRSMAMHRRYWQRETWPA